LNASKGKTVWNANSDSGKLHFVDSPLSDEEMKKEIERFALCKRLGLPYKGPAMALDAQGEEKLSPVASEWMLEALKKLPKLSTEEAGEAGARAAQYDIANRRRERAIAGPDEKRTAFQQALDRIIDERDAAAAAKAAPPKPKEESVGKGYYKFWFNRVEQIVTLLLGLPLWIAAMVIGWNFKQNAPWYYCLLFALMFWLAALAGWELAFVPIRILFWILDGRYPIKDRLVLAGWNIFFLGIPFSILFGIWWVLMSHHFGPA
jgi:hypothetical protein